MKDLLIDLALMGTGSASMVNWSAAWRGKLSLYYVTKPLVLVGLILLLVLWVPISAARLPFLIGLVFSLLGDILLIPSGTRWFVAGMAAFSVAQLMYIWGFNKTMPAPHVWLIGLGAVVIVNLLLHRAVDKLSATSGINKAILPFIKGYGALVSTMAISGVVCLARPGWSVWAAVLAGVGGVLFLISDGMIALEKLDRRLPKHRFWIILTYHLAQFLIVSAVITL